MPDNNPILKAALYYEQFGLSIIPVNPESKKPLLSWKAYQERRATPDEIKGWFKKWPLANIGAVTGSISGICAIDIDSPEGYPMLESHIPDSLVFPVADTPRGGAHFFFKCPDVPITTKADIFCNDTGVDSRGQGGFITLSPSVRENGKYTWRDGLRITDVPLPVLPKSLVSIINHQKSLLDSNGHQTASKNHQSMFVNGRRNDDIFHTAHLLLRGGAHRDEVEQILAKVIESCGYPADEAQTTINSALERAEKKERNLQGEVREFVDLSTGSFDLISIYNSLNLKERKEKNNTCQTLLKLCKEGVIEKVGNKNGHYRKVDNVCEYLDLENASDDEFAISLPLAIEQFAILEPKNIVIVAGEKDTGKTAFLLNIAAQNISKYKINYLSSEMGANAMKRRALKFDLPLSTWRGVFWERGDKFADVIKPEALNIIDFLEIHEDFFKVGLYIKEIFDKLTTGIAVIAIQKRKNSEFGLGGGGSLEKARLAINLSRDDKGSKATITVAKNRRHDEMNPVGLERYYKLVQGCKFIPETSWELGEATSQWKKPK